MTASLPALLISIPKGVIDLGWGHPSARLHPLEAMQQATAYMFANTGTGTLQYGAEQGFGPLLESLAEFLSQQEAYAMHVEPETLLLTCGASQGLDLACTLLTHPDDTVFVEEPTYYLVQRIFTAGDIRGTRAGVSSSIADASAAGGPFHRPRWRVFFLAHL